MRDLGHVGEAELRYMEKFGSTPKTVTGEKLHGHHHQQRYHREPGAFIVEMPKANHKLSSKTQHPLGTGGGIGADTPERRDWNKLREAFHRERAKTELTRRGLS